MGNKGSRLHSEQNVKKSGKTTYSDDGYIPMTSAMRRNMIDGRKFHHVIPSTLSLRDRKGLNSLTDLKTPSVFKVNSNNIAKGDNYNMTKSVSLTNQNRPNSVSDNDHTTAEHNPNETIKSNLKNNPCEKGFTKFSRSATISAMNDTKMEQQKSKFTLQLEKRLRQSKLELGFDTDIDSLKEFVYKYEDVEVKKTMGSLKKKKEKTCLTNLVGNTPVISERKDIYEPNYIGSKSKIKIYDKDETIQQRSSTFIASVPLDDDNDCKLKQKIDYNDITNKLITRSFQKSVSQQSRTNKRTPRNDQPRRVGQKYCNHSCQILGLCSVGRPQITKPTRPISSNIITHTDDINNNITTGGVNWKTGKHDKNECNCELCTLAYLTDMGFPAEYRSPTSTIKEVAKPCKTYLQSKNNFNTNNNIERVRIIECGDSYREVDVSVNDSPSNKESSTDGCSSKGSLSTLHQDSTNQKIRRMFDENNISPPVNHIYRGRLDASEICVRNKPRHPGFERNIQQQNKYPLVQIRANTENSKEVPTVSSSSVLTASISSSLSTVMSYKRVRLLFQTIINKNKSRKRTRKNINKFKEMEELGLGTLKNNRWYPSGEKTYSIWNNMNSKVNGVQAEFKKYPKTSIKPL